MIHQFFDQYLPSIRGVSGQTVKAYRDAFQLFLPFAASFNKIKVKSLRVEHITVELIVAFLEDLQSERKNTVKTRNHRLAALKSFAKMIRFMHPDQQRAVSAILNIPQKREQKGLIGFLYQDEMLRVFQDRLFINQRGEAFTRHGIYRICRKYLQKALPKKRLKYINPVHSFRHSRAVDMLHNGHPITDIKNHLGHDNIQSTTIYLHLDLDRRRHIQKQFIRHMQSVLADDSKIEELL
jgi:site-specific recombinase XerD